MRRESLVKILAYLSVGIFLLTVLTTGILHPEEAGKGEKIKMVNTTSKSETFYYKMENFEKQCKRIFGKQVIEIIAFFTMDENIYVQTNNDSDHVDIDILMLEKNLERNGETIKDVVFIVHNHLYPIGFTDEDKRFYRKLLDMGFRGFFCLWYRDKITEIMVPVRERE